MPFRWHKSKYMCFYCRSLFVESAKLKEHTELEHQEIEIEEIIIRTLYRKGRIKIDVSDLWCSRCENLFSNFLDYFNHLPVIHGIYLDKEAFQWFDCFRLGDNGMSCLDCGQYFRFFGPLLLHRHKYHTDHFLCEICGQGFVGKHNVDNHVKQIHSIKSCKDCNLTFPTQYSLATHVENVHRTDKLKCPLCPEISGNRYLKKRHMALVHDCKSAQFVCELCSKIFTRHNKYVQHKSRVHYKEKNCTCEVCGQKAFNTDALRRHMICHDEARPFKCEVCDKTFRRKKTLIIHKRTHGLEDDVLATNYQTQLTDERYIEKQRKDDLTRLITIVLENSTIMPFRWAANKYMCFYCCCTFVDSVQLKQHTLEEHKDAKLRRVLRTLISSSRVKLDTSEILCKRCPKRLENFDTFLKHVAETHEFKFNNEITRCIFTFNLSDDGMSCHECGQEFRFFGPLLKHAHKYHNKYKTFLCEICGQGFVAKANVESHIKNVHSLRDRQCVKCDKVFKNPYALQVHREKAHKTESLACPKCSEVFPSKYLKKRHLALVHDVKKLQFTCNECNRVYTMKSRLVQHQLRTHVKQKTVTCDICGFKVFNNDLLKRHMVRHDDSRPFQCDFCKKSFQRKKTLEVHRRIHTNDRRYACKECGRSFVQVTSYKLHMRVHHGGNEGSSWQ